MVIRKIFTWIAASLFLIGCESTYHEALYSQKPAFYSYIIGDVGSNYSEIENAADVYSSPASCQKVVTALLAYKALGPQYVYETGLFATYRNGKIQDVILSFSGDPTLTSQDLNQLLRPLAGTSIPGHLILDASYFKAPPYSPNIMIEDMGTSYAQPVSSMIIDQNLINITAIPARLGKEVKFENDCGYVIETTVKTTQSPSNIRLFWKDNRLVSRGNYHEKETILKFKMSPKEITNYIDYKIKIILKKLNIKGKIRIIHDRSLLPSKLTFLNTVYSNSLRHLIPPALKKSDNLVFDSLYLSLMHSKIPGGIEEWNEGSNVMKELIQQYFDIDVKDALLVDGSGLSRYNKIQPRKLFDILKKGYFINEFVTALPFPAEEKSTLAKRNKLPAFIKAKTGNMSGLSCLCGYRPNSLPPKAFVIMANSFAPPLSEMFTVMDQFIDQHIGQG